MTGEALVVRVLGPTRAWRGAEALDLGPTGRRAVLGLLTLADGRPLARHELIDALWGDQPPPSAVNVLQTHVKHLRHLLEPDRRARTPSERLPNVGDGYALRLPPGAVDVAQFRELVALAGDAERRDDRSAAADLLGRALALWDGLPLADVPLLATHPRVLGLVGERRSALARYAEAMVATGRAAHVLPLLVEDAAAHPLDEAAQARLVRAYSAAGQRGRAFATYDVARRALADELGVGPGPDLAAAYLALLDEAPAGTPVRGVNQLPGDVFGFTGRSAELGVLDEMLATGDQLAPPIGLICGTAGVGKTALAVRWAHRVRANFPDGLLYVDLRGYDAERPMSPGEALARLLDGVAEAGPDAGADTDRQAARYRAAIADRRVLVVLDNASSVDQVRLLLPGTPTCVTLVTSRDRLAGLVAVHGARRLDVGLLPDGDAMALLRTLVGARVDASPEAAAELAAHCARLPLALRVAAELAAARPSSSLADLAGELADRRRRLHRLDPGGDVRAAVRTVLSWSYQHLRPDVARAFRRIGLHPGVDLDGPALAALTGSSPVDAAAALDVLARNHLVELAAGNRFGAHDLLRAYAAELAEELDRPDERDAAVDRLLAYFLGTAAAAMDALYPVERAYRPRVEGAGSPMAPARAEAWLDAERSNLVALCAYAEAHGRPDTAVDLAATLYRYLEGGHYTDALAIHGAALRAARRTGCDAKVAGALANLGAVHRLLGNYATAVEHLRDAIELHRRTGDRYGAARAISNLGIVEERLGDYDVAAAHQREALAAHREVGNRYGEAAARLNLGNAYTRPGHYEEAAGHLAAALALFRALGDRVGEASALSNLGDVCTSLDRYTDAAAHLADARALFRATNHRYGEAATLSNLGHAQTRLGRHDEAAASFREALGIFRGIGHRYGEASALNGLGEALLAAGRVEEARAAHEAALGIATGTGDSDEQARARQGLATR